MDLSGEYRIQAPRQRVWEALNDPEILRQCIAGVESLEKTADNSFSATVNPRIGPGKLRFSGTVSFSDLDPPNGYTISGQGQGGVAGFAKGSAQVRLAEDGAVTVLTYNADAQVGGKLAQVGSRLVAGASKKMADDFFGKFTELLGGAAPGEAEAAPEAVPAPEARPGVPPALWVLALIIVVALLLWWMG